jgi:hypothetical protein
MTVLGIVGCLVLMLAALFIAGVYGALAGSVLAKRQR